MWYYLCMYNVVNVHSSLCMYMCTPLYACTCALLSMHVHVHSSLCMYMCTPLYACTCALLSMHVHVHSSLCMYMCTPLYACTCALLSMHVLNMCLLLSHTRHAQFFFFFFSRPVSCLHCRQGAPIPWCRSMCSIYQQT